MLPSFTNSQGRMTHGLLLALASDSITDSYAQIGAAAASVTPATIRLEGLVAPLRTLTAADLAALPHRKQTTTDKEGKKHVYRGVALADVLAQARRTRGQGPADHRRRRPPGRICPTRNRRRFLTPNHLAGRPPRRPAAVHPRWPLLAHCATREKARWVRQLMGLRVVKVY